ncbi:MAG: PIN domain-containing protein [Candidatus Sumerlaeota bacterium]|nr:PIN domain-containing protein [Candidatus Sumerlaeota bacterium]
METIKPVFLDASYGISLASETDDHHTQAVEWSHRIQKGKIPIVTTCGVALEIGNAFSKMRFRRHAITLLNALINSPAIDIVPITTELFHKGFSLFQQRMDKEWGMTDCVSFIVMREYGLTDALTADHHFRQAGFRALLLEN